MAGWRHLAAFAVVVVLIVGEVPAAAAQPDVSFTGSGWGHGVGLSQYGTKALAVDGANYEEIISRYFTGAMVATYPTTSRGTFVADDDMPFWVGLRQMSENLSFVVQEGSADLCFDLTEICVAIALPGRVWRFTRDGSGGCVFIETLLAGGTRVVGPARQCSASVRPRSAATIVHIPYKARSYRHGILRFRDAPSGSGLHTVLEIGVEGYMRGLSEVPESWPAAAIRTQVVTSRSYAIWHALDRGSADQFSTEHKNDCHCNLRDDSSDQVFRGWTGEVDHPNWVAAVEATTNEVIAVGGFTGLGLYSSSSGGHTENHSDVFGDGSHPHLVTADDGAALSDTAANPHATWSAGYNQLTLADAFGFSWVSDVEVTARNESGSARTLAFRGIRNGRPAEESFSAVDVRSTLSLRSTTFDVAVYPRFDDVPASHIFSGEVLGLSELGVTSGCSTTGFCPDRAVTRAEMAAFLVRALGLPTGGVDAFADDDGHVLEAEISTLAASGITTGCSTTGFCPDRAVTRAEMAAFLVRGFGLDYLAGDPFDDDNGHFFEAEISALAASGITSGCSTTGFCPDRAVTRAEMAAFLVRALA